QADLRDVEVRVAAEVGADCAEAGSQQDGADVGFRGPVVTDPGIAAEQAGRPVRIPVVVERTADAPGCRQMKRSVTPVDDGEEDGIAHRTEGDALISTRKARSAEHRKAV